MKLVEILPASNRFWQRLKVNVSGLPKGWLRASVTASIVIIGVAITLGYEAHLSAVRWFDDIPVTSLRDSEVGPAISRWWEGYQQSSVTLTIGDSAVAVTVGQIGYDIDIPATLNRLRRVRQIGCWKLHKEFPASKVEPVAHVEDTTLERLIDDWEQRSIGDRPVQAELLYEKGGVLVHAAKAGRVIDRRATKRRILERLNEMRRMAIDIPLTRVEPGPDATTLEVLRDEAEHLVKSPVVLEAAELPLKIHLSRSELGRLLRILRGPNAHYAVAFDGDALNELLQQRRVQLELPAKNATLTIKPGNRFVVVPETVGYRISPASLATRLLEAARSPSHRAPLDVVLGEPAKIKAEDVEHLGIRELMGEFTTRHACCQPRVNNIHRIADLLDGVIVLPGETFSVNDFVGPRTLGRGFVMAPSIEDGEMVETIGGGVSQFATTLYNALLRSGLEILERRAHTYWFDRYPMGHEATLSIPKPDLVFRNDTKSGVLIHTEYTERSITVKLYGDLEGRKVAFGVSGMQDIEQVPVERLPNPDVSPDKERIKNGGRIGWSVVTWRTVTLPNGEQKKDERKVTYKPQVRRIEVHPCRLQPDEPGYTGEVCPKVEPEDTDAGLQ